MASLYDLTEEWQWRAAALDDCETQEEYDAAIAQIMEVEGNISERADAYARIMKNKQAEAESLAVEIKRLQAKKKAAESFAERLKNYMLYCMETVGADRLKTSIGTWSTQLNPPKVVVTDADLVPLAFRIPQPDEINKTAILEAFRQTGEVFPGCEIERKPGIRFR